MFTMFNKYLPHKIGGVIVCLLSLDSFISMLGGKGVAESIIMCDKCYVYYLLLYISLFPR